MQYTRLGKSGLKVSRLALGCMTYGSSAWRKWVLDEDDALPFFRQAWEAGINFFDTADMYSNGASEEVLGHALTELRIRREEVVIASKLFFPLQQSPNERGTSRKHVRHAIDDSLRRLGTDYIDLYQIHRYDTTTSMEETLEALTDLVRAGKVLYLGASSMAAWEFATFLHLAERHGLSRFVSMQNHYNLVYREEEREMIPLCRAEGIGLIPWSPLARGFLAGNRQREDKSATVRAQTDDFAERLYYQPADFQIVDRVSEVARERGVSNAQVALAWVLQQPGITAPIVGASKPHHLSDAVKALDLILTAEEMQRLQELYTPHPVLGIA